MGGFGAGSHWRRWDPNFHGYHAVFCQRLDAGDRVWWMDPLGPIEGYAGEWMPKDDLRQFVRAWPGALHLVAPLRVTGGPQMSANTDPIPIASTVPTLVDLPKLHDLYRTPGDLQAQVPSEAKATPVLFSTGTGWLAVDFRNELWFVKGLTTYPAEVVPDDRYDQGRRDEWAIWSANFPPRP
jgi:hypothetical protein